MLDFLKRDRSPRLLVGTLVLAWVVMVATSQAAPDGTPPWLSFAMAVVLIAGLLVTAFCLVKLALHALRR